MQVSVEKTGSAGQETGTKMKKIKQKHQKYTAKEKVILWTHDKGKTPNAKEKFLSLRH